ncbi:MAG: organic solvent tolerance protein [Bdellovibrionaceae bacterium]|nr:organic solvent tolerance protein [Bdellovibrionales bacterium]MCB9083410.1 organic solvent tolerance protein [Pseudobdellovibrionaceae bacterium]
MKIKHLGRWQRILAGGLVGLGLLVGSQVQAKELTNRLGVGYSDQFGESLPSLAVRYYPNSQLGLSASLGVDTRKDNSRFGFMARVHRVIFMEANLNFYMGAGAGILSVETAGKNESGFELSGFFGAEFFLYGLDSLAFMFESGVGVTSISSEVRFRTLGDHPVKAGIAFYF